jgi:N-methylhydantoinase B
MSDQQKLPMDGVRLAIITSRFEGIARKMANTLLRSGRSGVLNTARDFSCCVVTARCELLASAESLPIHVLSGPDLMVRSMFEFHQHPRAGDAFLHNSPYHGCSHPADFTILVPVFDGAERSRFVVVAKAHQADCGNSQPTTYMGGARDVYEEGALIFPAVKIQSDYRDVEDVVRMCRQRIRVPEQWWGDYLATLGAARIGEGEIKALAAEVGWDVLDEYAAEWFAYSERRMIEALGAVPAGSVSRSSTHDPFPGTPPEGVPVNVAVTARPQEAIIEVDLRDNPDNLPCGLNLSESCARTAAMVGIFNSIDHTVPKNAGSFRRIRVHLREGCVVGIPKHPTSCSVATTNVADRVANAVQSAIAELKDGIGMAEAGAVIPPAVGVISGRDPRSGEPFVNQVFLAMTGGAGAPRTDAWMTIGHVGNAGLCYIDSIEIDEMQYPIFVKSRSLVQDSEGAGRRRGAPSASAEFGPIDDCILEVGYVSDGAINSAKGTRGGLNGSPSRQFKRLRNSQIERLDSCAQIRLQPGEFVWSLSCGGGGYGSPLDRDPERVRLDVSEGYVSVERARIVYGVVIATDGTVDEEETTRLRADLASPSVQREGEL